MTLTLSDEQMEEVRRGRAVSVRSEEVREPLVVCPQSEFAAVVLSVVRDVRDRLGDRLSEDELREEIEDALIQKAWADLGRRARDAWARENPY